MMAAIRWGRRLMGAWVAVVLLVSGVASLEAAVKPRAIIIVTFDASTLPSDDQWVGEGIAQVLSLGLAQHPGFVEIERARLRAAGGPEVWGEAAVTQAARSLKVDVALYGQVVRTGGELVIHPRLLDTKGGTAADVIAMEPVPVPEGELLARL